MTRLAIFGDTHVPSRANRIPDWVREEIRQADHTIHTGDFDSPSAHERVVDLSDGNLTAVRGNMDPASADLPSTDSVTLEGVTFVVTHGTGSPEGWHDRVAGTVLEEAGTDAVGVAGHTHEVTDEVVDGVRLVNPGSATAASPADRETMYVADLEDGNVDLELLTG